MIGPSRLRHQSNGVQLGSAADASEAPHYAVVIARAPLASTLGGLSVSDISEQWTEVQGQYLAFIRAYSLVNGRAPAEADMQRFFGVTPPSVHQMVLTLEGRGLIARTVGAARSIRVLVPAEHLPSLQERR